ncbi:MAG: hypothetical protein GJU76_06115 [Gallionella sp.]|jgi:hypothetical protein|nr:hypothetical protein [Gallionella sp.]
MSNERGATWVDDENQLVWLCAVHGREDGSRDDAYIWFHGLHARGALLPTEDDVLRDHSEKVVRYVHQLSKELNALVEKALEQPETEFANDLDDWMPCRVYVIEGDGVQEVWCALSAKTTDQRVNIAELRNWLFALLIERFQLVGHEARFDWPTGPIEWFEAVRFGLRESEN